MGYGSKGGAVSVGVPISEFNALQDAYNLRQGAVSTLSVHSDDGHVENKREFYEIWKPLNIPLSIAIVKDFVGTPGYLTESDIVQMHKDGCEIMGHSVTHAQLTTLTLEQARVEFEQSKLYLENLIGDEVHTFVYPGNMRNEDLDRIGLQYFKGLRGSGAGSSGVDDVILPNVHDFRVQIDGCDFSKGPAVALTTYRKIYSLANCGGVKGIVYYHYATDNAAITDRASFDALKEMAKSMKQQGFNFVKARDIYAKDMFGEIFIAKNDDIARYSTVKPGTSNITIDSANAWGIDKAFKFSNPTIGNSDKPYIEFASVSVKPMTLYCFSRREHIVTNMSTTGRGIAIAVKPIYRDIGEVAQHYPRLNDDLYKNISDPIQYLARNASDGILKTYYVTPPDCISLKLQVVGYNIDSDVWVSDLHFNPLKTFKTISGEATLNGTVGIPVLTGWVETGKYEVIITPRASIAGHLYVVKSSERFTIYSTSSEDTTQSIGWTIVPKEYDMI